MKCPSCGGESYGAVCPFCGSEMQHGPVNVTNNYYTYQVPPHQPGNGPYDQPSTFCCPGCRSNNISFRREQAGYGFRTIGICGKCGFTWDEITNNASAYSPPPYSTPPYGTPQYNPYNRLSPRSKGMTALLCIFGGYLGFHQFYVGRIGTGLLYLFTCGLCGIGWLIDLIGILNGTFTDSNGLLVK